MITGHVLLKDHIIKVLTDIKYNTNIIIENQNKERNVCIICNGDQANDQIEENNLFDFTFPIKNDEDLQKLEDLLINEQNRAKLVRYLLILIYIYVFDDSLDKFI